MRMSSGPSRNHQLHLHLVRPPKGNIGPREFSKLARKDLQAALSVNTKPTRAVATDRAAVKPLFTGEWRKRFGRGGLVCARIRETPSRKRVNSSSSNLPRWALCDSVYSFLELSACAASDGGHQWEGSRHSPIRQP